MPKGPEAQLQKACLDLLAAKYILAFRMQSGATVSEYKGRTRMIRYGVQGMADILAFAPHGETLCFYPDWATAKAQIVYWIECKAPKGRQTEEQKSFQKQVEGHGHRYAIIRSIEELEALL